MNKHRYTKEEHQFMEEYVPGHSHEEIRKRFTERFGWEITTGQVIGYIGNHHLHTGRDGRFKKGRIPTNKGKKGIYGAGCEKTWFKKGNIPKNHRPVGSERISKDGYVEVKVAEPNRWKKKHRAIWEAEHGEVPKGHIVIFRDNDKTNVEITNLMLIKRSAHAVMNHTGLNEYTGELKESAVRLAELASVIKQAKKGDGRSCE